jgi:ribose transport system substrate-binding protein
MGYEGVKAIAQIARGQGTPQKRIDTGATVVTKANMEQPDVHKLLYPLEKQASAR